MKYKICKAVCRVDLAADWDSDCWQGAEKVKINQFRRESSSHRPLVQAKVIYDHLGFYVHFRVADRYVLARQKGYNVPVCRDSCVEFFFQPFGQGGYFNFELNCSGSILCYYITDHSRTRSGFARYEKLTDDDLRQIGIYHTLPKEIHDEIGNSIQWRLSMHIPFKVLEKYTGRIPRMELSGSSWRGNFYKCADDSSHPHWASWSPVPELNFHAPEAFGELVFE